MCCARYQSGIEAQGRTADALKSTIVAEMWRRGELSAQLRATQLAVYEWWSKQQAILSVWHARRGAGKTWLFLTDAFEQMARNDGWRLIYAAPTREAAKQIVIPTALLMIPPDLPADCKPVWVASEHAFVHPKTKSRLIVEGADDERGNHLRGPFAHRVYGDEVGFWRYLDYVYRSILFPQVERRLHEGARMLFGSTSPESPHHEFAQVIIPEAKAEGAYRVLSIDDDTTLSQAQKDTIAAQHDPKRDPAKGRKTTAYQREYGCKIVIEAERAVVPEFDKTRHVGVIELPDFYDAYVWLDLGMVDLTAALFAFYHFDKATIVVQSEIVRQYQTVSDLAPEISAEEKRLWNQSPRARISDNHPMEIAEFHRQHILQPTKVTGELKFAPADNRNPEALINRTRSMFAADRILIHPSCIGLINQLEGGLWNQNRTDFEKIKGLGHLDGIMALAYGVDTVDYVTNPNLRKKLNPETHAIYLQRSKQEERYGKLGKLLHPATRRH